MDSQRGDGRGKAGTLESELMFLVVGELINSSREEIKRALEERDETCVRRLARAQAEAGACVIDLNTAQSLERELEDIEGLIEVVEHELGKEARISIDTADPRVMRGAAEVCSAPAIINSISNEPSELELIQWAAESDVDVIALAEPHLISFSNTSHIGSSYFMWSVFWG